MLQGSSSANLGAFRSLSVIAESLTPLMQTVEAQTATGGPLDAPGTSPYHSTFYDLCSLRRNIGSRAVTY